MTNNQKENIKHALNFLLKVRTFHWKGPDNPFTFWQKEFATICLFSDKVESKQRWTIDSYLKATNNGA